MTTIISEKNQPINYDQVPCYSKQAITKIPDFVFGNFNQYTCKKYEEKALGTFREKTETITIGRLKELCNKEGLTPRETTVLFALKAEECDWIHGLNVLETYLEKTKENPNRLEENLTSELVFQCNELFTRLISGKNAGKIRTNAVFWRKHNFDVNELVAGQAIEEYLAECTNGEEFFSSLSKIGNTSSLKKDINWLKKKLSYQKEHPENCNLKKEQIEKINPEIVDVWAKEQNSINEIDLCAWVRHRYHYFPNHEMIRKELEVMLKVIKNPKMHPIKKASFLWFNMVRIHIFDEANKRTAKALASIILLAHGYLPPKISKNDAQEYFESLMNGFEKEKGLEEFSQFIIRKIIQTQEEYKEKIP